MDTNHNTYTDHLSCWGYFGRCKCLLRKRSQHIQITLRSFTKHTHCSTNLLVSLHITHRQKRTGKESNLTLYAFFSWTTSTKSYIDFDIALIQRDSWNMWHLKWKFYIYLHLHYDIHLPMEDRFHNRIANNKGNWDFLSHNSEKKTKQNKKNSELWDIDAELKEKVN